MPTRLLIALTAALALVSCRLAFPTGRVSLPEPFCAQPNEHDIGDGTCGPVEQCAERFTLLPDGRCAGFVEIEPIDEPTFGHTATTLANGHVLVAGGFAPNPEGGMDAGVVKRARIFNPRDDTWAEIPDLPGPRYAHTSFPAHPIGVHVAGGLDNATAFDSLPNPVYHYEPRSQSWEILPGLEQVDEDKPARHLQSMRDGRLLVLFSAEPDAVLVELETGELTPLPPLPTPRSSFRMIRLERSGDILVVGGWTDGQPVSAVERLDAETLTWSVMPNLRFPRVYPAVVELEDGSVLVIGGHGSQQPLPWVEVFDPELGAWEELPAMAEDRAAHSATRLADGSVLVIGGSSSNNYNTESLDTAERFDPITRSWSPVGRLVHPRRAHTATLLGDGRVLIIGGVMSSTAMPVPVVETFVIGH